MRRFPGFALGEWRRYCIAVFGVALVWAAVMPASQSTAQQSASATAPQAAAPVEAVTLRSIDPNLVGKIGFNNPSYANLIPGARSGDLGPGGLSERFTAPDGKPITIAIGAPRVGSTYDVPPIQSGEDPSVYFANALAAAGARKTIRFPRGGVYDFPAAACQRLGAHLKINAAQDAVIDGNASVLNFSSACPGGAFVNPVRVVFKNITIDWPKLQIASLGTVVDVGGGGPRRFTYGVQLDREYVSSAMPRSYKSINAWDAAHGFWSLQHPDHEVGYSPRQPLSAAGGAENVQSWTASFTKGERIISATTRPRETRSTSTTGRTSPWTTSRSTRAPASASPCCKAVRGSRSRTARSRGRPADPSRRRPTPCTSPIAVGTSSSRTTSSPTRAMTA
jgi:hypothetical protein